MSGSTLWSSWKALLSFPPLSVFMLMMICAFKSQREANYFLEFIINYSITSTLLCIMLTTCVACWLASRSTLENKTLKQPSMEVLQAIQMSKSVHVLWGLFEPSELYSLTQWFDNANSDLTNHMSRVQFIYCSTGDEVQTKPKTLNMDFLLLDLQKMVQKRENCNSVTNKNASQRSEWNGQTGLR